jgi:hypothetical protein
MSRLKPTGSAARAAEANVPADRSAAKIQAGAETDPKSTRATLWDGFMRTVNQVRQTDDPALGAIRPRTSPLWPPRAQDRGSTKRGPVLGSPATVSITMVLRIELRARQG